MTFQIRFKTHYFNSKGPLTAPSLRRPDSLQWVLSGNGVVRENTKKSHLEGWRDSPDMGHYFKSGAPLFQITKKDMLLLYFPAQSISSWKCPPPPTPKSGGLLKAKAKAITMRVTHTATNLARNSDGLQGQRTL